MSGFLFLFLRKSLHNIMYVIVYRVAYVKGGCLYDTRATSIEQKTHSRGKEEEESHYCGKQIKSKHATLICNFKIVLHLEYCLTGSWP